MRALERRLEQEHARQELLVGIITSHVVNFSMNPPKDGASPEDFMPSILRKRQRGGETLEDDEIAARIDATLKSIAVPIEQQLQG